MLIIVASMGAELAGLRREVEEFQASHRTKFQAEFHLLGVGPERSGVSMAKLLETELLDNRRPGAGRGKNKKADGVLLLGVAGAVVSELETGSLLLAGRYAVDVPGSEPKATAVLEPDAEMLKQAELAAAKLGMPINQGTSLTVDHLVGHPRERQQLREKYRVDSINMEDYTVAEAAAKAGVPFLSVRIVLDTASQQLPDYLEGLSRSKFRLLTRVLGMPWRIPTLWRIKNQLTLCQAVITGFGMAYLNLEVERTKSAQAQAASRALY